MDSPNRDRSQVNMDRSKSRMTLIVDVDASMVDLLRQRTKLAKIQWENSTMELDTARVRYREAQEDHARAVEHYEYWSHLQELYANPEPAEGPTESQGDLS